MRAAAAGVTLPEGLADRTLTTSGEVAMPTFVLTNGPDTFSWGSIENVEVYGLAGNDTITGNDGADSLFGAEGDDRLFGDDNLLGGSDYLQGGAGNDTLDGGDENDVVYGDEGHDHLIGGFGDDRLYGGDGNDYTEGGLDNDYIDGGDGNDYLNGDDGNDHIVAGAGADVLRGGSGNDRLVAFGSFTDAPDVLIGGSGDDVYVLSGAGVYDIRSSTEAADPGIDRIDSGFSVNIGAYLGIEDVYLTGTANTSATGNARDNRLIGNAGNNTLIGGGGVDTLIGGAGNDKYYFDSGFDRAIEQAGQGLDEIYSTVSLTLAGRANVENLYLQNSAIFATGNTIANRLVGNTQNNVFDGGAGYDTLEGGLGNDSYYLNDVSPVNIGGFPFSLYDKVIETGGAGIDTVHVGEQPSFTGGTIRFYRLDTNVENGVVTGAGAFDIEGNGLDNAFYGNAAANTLTGLGGNDVLEGAGGHDILIGGPGNDTYYLIDNAPYRLGGFTVWDYDEVQEAPGSGYAGVDTIYVGRAANPFLAGGFTTGYTLGAPIENGVILGAGAFNLGGNALHNVLTGNDQANNIGGGAAGNDTLYGMGGDDFLDGGTGYDTMYGGAGNDIFYVDSGADQVIESSDSGFDGVISRVSYVLPANVEVLSLYGAAYLAGTGNASHNTIQGQDGNNVLRGLDGSDILQGFDGDDVLYGGLGSDTLYGGAGFDRFYFDTTPHPTLNFDAVDFNPAHDTIVLENAVFTALTATGWLSASAFRLGANALDADDRIMYDAATGQLIYDSNGNAAGGRIPFANIGIGLTVTNYDFLVQ
jgi:Ca2+-binding RTX toxin-like protein